MNTLKHSILAIIAIMVIAFTSCHPWQWEDLPRIEPDCPSVAIINPAGASAGEVVTVTGSNFDEENLDQFTLTINGKTVAIKSMRDSTTLQFVVPEGIGSGVLKIARSGNFCGEGTQFTYFYSLERSPAIYAGVENNTNYLNGPRGMDIDADGNLFVADKEHQVIQRIDTEQGMTVIAGHPDIADFADNIYNGQSAYFANPSDVALDRAGNIYVADQENNRIRKITNIEKYPVVTYSGKDASTGLDGSITDDATYNKPDGVAVDSVGNVYVVEYSGHRLRMLNISTGKTKTLGGNGSATGLLSFPTGVTCLSQTSLDELSVFVADYNHGIIQGFDLNGHSSKVPNVTVNPFSFPVDVDVDSQGNLFVVASNKVYVLYADGQVREMTGYNFSGAAGIAYDERHKKLYVSDNMKHVIVRYELK